MPLFYQHNPTADCKLAIWKIEETEEFFLRYPHQPVNISHPYKRLQHLAGRFLLNFLCPEFELEKIRISDSGKPFLPEQDTHFSISHSGNFAAAIVSKKFPVGIDLELETPRILSVAPRFLSLEELNFLSQQAHLPALYRQLMTLFWSAKETMYKWYGKGQVDFKQDLNLHGPLVFHSDEHLEMCFHFGKELNKDVTVKGQIFSPLVLTWMFADHPFKP